MVKILYSLIIVSLLITSMLSGCIEIGPKEDVEGITAMEGLELAEEVALNWSKNATLVTLNKAESMVSSGSFTAWYYTFYHTDISMDDAESVDSYKIKVNSNMTFEYRETLNTSTHQSPIYKWTIDSDEAYEIAMGNENIKEFLSEYKRADVERFTLFGGEGGSDPAWKIHWSYFGGMFDDPVHAGIRINARTGEVIEVDADI